MVKNDEIKKNMDISEYSVLFCISLQERHYNGCVRFVFNDK